MPNLEEAVEVDSKLRTFKGRRASFNLIGITIEDEFSVTVTLGNNSMLDVTQGKGGLSTSDGPRRFFSKPQISVYQDSVSEDNQIPNGDNVFTGGTINFGRATIGGSLALIGDIGDVLRGAKFTTNKGGSARSITVRLQVSGSSKPVKCAIYARVADGNAGSLIAATEERTIAVSTAWQTFNFSAPYPILNSNTTYYLVCWTDGGAGEVRMYFSVVANKGVFNNTLAYDGFPSPMTGEISDNGHYSLYCTYVPKPNYKLWYWVDWGSTDVNNLEISFKTVVLNLSGSSQTIIYKANIRSIIT